MCGVHFYCLLHGAWLVSFIPLGSWFDANNYIPLHPLKMKWWLWHPCRYSSCFFFIHPLLEKFYLKVECVFSWNYHWYIKLHIFDCMLLEQNTQTLYINWMGKKGVTFGVSLVENLCRLVPDLRLQISVKIYFNIFT